MFHDFIDWLLFQFVGQKVQNHKYERINLVYV